MERLASPITRIKNHYKVVVVGSGYGGAIAASRLSRAGQEVCVLERGKELHPGEYPETLAAARAELQIDGPGGRVGSRTGLYDVHINEDVSVLVGCGLGGTSLINASVAIRPDPRVLTGPRWPRALAAEGIDHLARYFELAEAMLGSTPYPAHFPATPKLIALEKSAAAMGQRFYRPPLAVTFKDGPNAAGVEQKACVLCGDCVSGCNHNAKNTVLMNYLPDAKRHGAVLFTEVSVRYIERRPSGGYNVHYDLVGAGREAFGAPSMVVSADIVILAAGTLGSAEILLRSKERGLEVSRLLGQRFSGNGDVIGFAYNNTDVIDGVGAGRRDPASLSPRGPTITGLIDMRGNASALDDVIVEVGGIPGCLGEILPAALKAGSADGVNTAPQNVLPQMARELESAARGPYYGAVKHTQTFLAMGHDGAEGQIVLEGDRARVRWPRGGDQPIFHAVEKKLIEITRTLQGIFTRDPLWSELMRRKLLTVHPLGGCVMADAADEGVVNHKGQVFSGAAGDAVHEGLYVCDGSTIPTSLGVNPLLTISALAERCCAILCEERGFAIDYTEGGGRPLPPEERHPGIRFTERMAGAFSSAVDADYKAAAKRGEAEGSTFEFVLTVTSPDVNAMLAGPLHEAILDGTVVAPRLSARPITVTGGVFRLFKDQPGTQAERIMRYEMSLVTEEGRRLFFSGYKTILDRLRLDVWNNTTTLYIDVFEGDDASGPAVGRGVLRITPDDFIRQLGTMQATGARSAEEQAIILARFGKFFAGSLYERYATPVKPVKRG